MKIDGNQVKVGNILEINSKLWKVTKTQHTQPGKGGAYIQVEMKDISSGTKINERFRSSESVERAILEEKKCQFLYFSNEKFFFMDNVNYEQIEIGKDIINEDQTKLLIENDEVIIQFHENSPISLLIPDQVCIEVLQTEAVVKGQTSASSFKPATLERGLKTNVPPFIEVGDRIIISSKDLSYIEKYKK